MFKDFDCDENTSEEQKKALAKYPYRGSATASGGMNPTMKALLDQMNWDDVKQIDELPPPAAAARPLVVVPSYIEDPFTCYVQEIVARTIYGADLPQDAADENVDPPELYEDKMFYHHAVQQGKLFHDKFHDEHIVKITKYIASTGAQGAVVDHLYDPNYEFTGDEPELFKALHNMLNLDAYINSAVRESTNQTETQEMTYVQIWKHLTTEAFYDKPVNEWAELTMIDFVEYIYQLYRVWQYTLDTLK